MILLSAGAPQVRSAVPARTVPDGLPARWYGRRYPPPVDAVARRLRRGREPAHVGFVARPALVAELRQLVRTHRPQLVHLFGWGTAALLPHLAGVPAVHDAVDPWAANRTNRAVGRAHALLDAGEDSRIRAHEKRWYPALSRVVVRTDEDARQLAADVPAARVVVVPNGVDPGPEPTPARGEVLAFLGAYDAHSNVEAARELVTQVLPLVRQHRPGASVLLIGRDPPPGLQALAGEHVALTGTVEDVRPHLERAAVVVVPLRSGMGVRNKVLEAMAAARPVVATPLALHGIGPSDGVRSGESAADLARALLPWLADPAALAADGARNRSLVQEQFTWARSSRVLEQVWEQACASTS